MEFHVAHEQVVNGKKNRRKYLIPLMMEKVNSTTIQDATLRMYVDSYTYLDCRDKVNLCILLHSMMKTTQMKET